MALVPLELQILNCLHARKALDNCPGLSPLLEHPDLRVERGILEMHVVNDPIEKGENSIRWTYIGVNLAPVDEYTNSLIEGCNSLQTTSVLLPRRLTSGLIKHGQQQCR